MVKSSISVNAEIAPHVIKWINSGKEKGLIKWTNLIEGREDSPTLFEGSKSMIQRISSFVDGSNAMKSIVNASIAMGQ